MRRRRVIAIIILLQNIVKNTVTLSYSVIRFIISTKLLLFILYILYIVRN